MISDFLQLVHLWPASSGIGEVIAIAAVIIGTALAAFAYFNMKLRDERRKTDRRVKEIRRKVA